MPPVSLNPQQREVLIEWMDEQADPFTVRDVATHFGCHEMTARKWLSLFRSERLIERYPWRRGRADQFVRTDGKAYGSDGPEQSEIARRAIRVACGNEQLSIAAWACRNTGHASIASVAYAMLYLFVRSYYYGAPEHEHLRGPIPELEVRSFIAEALAQIKRDTAVIEQLLQYAGPWKPGDELAQRFGELPDGITMTKLIEQAHFYVETIMRRGVVDEVMVAAVETIEAAAASGQETISVGDAMARLGTVSSGESPSASPPPETSP